MSSETSTDTTPSSETPAAPSQFSAGQVFTIAGLLGASAVLWVAKGQPLPALVLLCLLVFAAAAVGFAAVRTFVALTGQASPNRTQVLGGRTRAALDREKTLVLRSIKELEFDKAMGKVSDKDFAEMSGRLRARAAGLLRQLDAGATYRDQIEAEIARRLETAGRGARSSPGVDGSRSRPGIDCACGTANDADARFCKSCGAKLEAS